MRKWGLLLVLVVFGGCGELTQAEKECPNGVLVAEGKCKTVSEARALKRARQVEGEARETEAVLKRRHAEELANLAEGR